MAQSLCSFSLLNPDMTGKQDEIKGEVGMSVLKIAPNCSRDPTMVITDGRPLYSMAGAHNYGRVGFSKEQDDDDGYDKAMEEISSTVKSSDAAAILSSDVEQFELLEHSRQQSDEQVVPQVTLSSSSSEGERHLSNITPFEYNEHMMVGC